MIRRRLPTLVLAGILISGATASTAVAEIPVAVSPGDGSGFAEIADRCPSFSWGGVESALAYELAVYSVGERSTEGAVSQTDLGGLSGVHLAIRQQLPGKAFSWTPGVAQCLKPGERYAWSIRALGDEGESEIGADGLGLISYYDETNQALKVAHLGIGVP